MININTEVFSQYMKKSVKRYRGKVIPFLISSSLRSILLLLPSVITGHMIDKIIPKGSISQLLLYSLILVIIPIFSCVCIVIEYVATSFVMRIGGKLRVDLFDGIQNQTLEWHERWKTGDLLNRIIDEVGRIFETLYFSSGFFMWHVVTIIVGTFIMVKIEPFLGLIIAVLLFSKVLTIRFFTKKQQEFYGTLQQNRSEMINLTRESINAIEYIKFSSIEDQIYDRYVNMSNEFFKKDNELQIVRAIGKFINLLITASCIFLIFSLGSRKVINNELTIGKLISFYSVFVWSSQAFESFYSLLMNLLGIKPSYERVNEIFNYGTNSSEKDVHLDQFNYMELKNLSFVCDNKAITNNISLHINSSEKLAIIGESGAGKSMLSDMMMNFRNSTSGNVLINGKPMQYIDNEWIRNNLIIVSQNIQLRKGSILDNIVYAVDQYDINDVKRIVKIVELEDWINALPEGLNTNIGEGKSNLSGGEKQRISLARALMCNPEFMIFDEITSALDNVTANNIVNNLLCEYQQMTMLFITHDQKIINKMSRVIEINKGRVVADKKQ